MEGTLATKLDSQASELQPGTQSSKRRKVVPKTIVTVKIGENVGKLKNEGPPSDPWSWRKYGQKPIKGSPYPRGYYRCSTSKGCSAKKQVERCRTDSSLLIITYTSSHNHPGPDIQTIDDADQPEEHKIESMEDHPVTLKEEDPQEQEQEEVQKQPIKAAMGGEDPQEEQEEVQKQPITAAMDEGAREDHFHYLQSPLNCPQDNIINQQDPFTLSLERTHDTLGFLLDEGPLSCSHLITFSSTPKSEETDFFDELEELPASSGFSSFNSSSVSDESIPVIPS